MRAKKQYMNALTRGHKNEKKFTFLCMTLSYIFIYVPCPLHSRIMRQSKQCIA